MVLGADSAYVINLEKHQIRKKRMDHLIDKLKLDKVTYIKATDKDTFYRDTWGNTRKYLNDYFWDPNGMVSVAILSCALSHRKAYKAFLDSGDEVGLFLEDDIKNTSFIHQLNFNKLREELDSIDGWGVAIYGRYEKDILRGKEITPHFFENYYHPKQTSGHAYLLNRKSAQWLYDNTEKISYAADVLLEICPFKIITLDQSIFIQRYKDYLNTKTKFDLKKIKKYPWINEYLSSTTSEFAERLHNYIWRFHDVFISKYIPAIDWEKHNKIIQGRDIKGIKVKIGEKNTCFERDLKLAYIMSKELHGIKGS
jgi:GR25 family glycosyltransferase involved in LPS biosynthesis